MGINVQLEDEDGTCIKVLEKPLPRSLNLHDMPFYKSAEFPFVGGIDLYGDTLFNHLQADLFLEEWRILTERVDLSDMSAMDEVTRLAQACREGTHLYLRFVGD